MEPPPGREYLVQTIVLSTAFFCFLGCYMAGQSYLTSTREEGYFALAALYFAFSTSSAFADQIVARIGTKVSLTVAPQFYALFILCCGASFFSDSKAVHYVLLVTPGIGLGAAGVLCEISHYFLHFCSSIIRLCSHVRVTAKKPPSCGLHRAFF